MIHPKPQFLSSSWGQLHPFCVYPSTVEGDPRHRPHADPWRQRRNIAGGEALGLHMRFPHQDSDSASTVVRGVSAVQSGSGPVPQSPLCSSLQCGGS